MATRLFGVAHAAYLKDFFNPKGRAFHCVIVLPFRVVFILFSTHVRYKRLEVVLSIVAGPFL